MSELEAKEINSRIAALTKEEQAVVVGHIDSEIMFDELIRRHKKMKEAISEIDKTMWRYSTE